MLQWGQAYMQGTTQTFNYPTAFRSQVYQMVTTDAGSGAHSLGATAITLTSFTAYGNVATTNFRYIAIGA